MRIRHIIHAVLGLTAIAALVAQGHPARASQPRSVRPVFAISAADLAKRHVLRITAFGSSSTQGIGASSPAAAYPSRLQVDLEAALPGGDRVVVSNRGIGGEDAEDMLRRLPKILADHPDLVIWQTGTNDPLRGLPLTRFVELTRTGITEIRAAGSDVMLMEPQNCPAYANKPGALAYRDAVRAIGAEFGVPVVRRYDLMQMWATQKIATGVQLQARDGLHMSDEGYALLAQAVAKAILADMTVPLTTADAAARP